MCSGHHPAHHLRTARHCRAMARIQRQCADPEMRRSAPDPRCADLSAREPLLGLPVVRAGDLPWSRRPPSRGLLLVGPATPSLTGQLSSTPFASGGPFSTDARTHRLGVIGDAPRRSSNSGLHVWRAAPTSSRARRAGVRLSTVFRVVGRRRVVLRPSGRPYVHTSAPSGRMPE